MEFGSGRDYVVRISVNELQRKIILDIITSWSPFHFNTPKGVNTYKKIIAKNPAKMHIRRCLRKKLRRIAINIVFF